jgi:hypothetical protein
MLTMSVPSVYLPPKPLKMFLSYNLLTMSVHDEDYPRNAHVMHMSLNLISTFLLHDLAILLRWDIRFTSPQTT